MLIPASLKSGLLVMICAVPAHALTSTTASDQVVIQGQSSGSKPDRARSVTVFNQERIQSELNRGGDLSSLLDASAGARILDFGGPVQSKRLQIRGGSPAQAAVIMDGVPLRSPFATGLDLGMFALPNLQSVEVLRGGSGSLFGEGAISGAVITKTKRAGKGPLAEFGLGYGSLDRVEMDATINPGPILFAGSYRQSRGDFTYISDLPGLPELQKRRINNDGRYGRALARYDENLAAGRLAIIAGMALRESGIPGFETQTNARARESRGHGHARAMWQKGSFELGAFASGLSIDYTDPDGWAPIESQTRFSNFGADVRYGVVWSGHILSIGVLGQSSFSDSTDHGDVQRNEASFSIKDEFRVWDFDVSANLLCAYVTGFGLNLMPSLAAQRSMTENSQLRIVFGRSFRAPALDELFHPNQRGFVGNPQLEPESAIEGEAGLRWQWARGHYIDFSGFARRLDDMILYLNRNAFEIRPENAGAADLLGLELQSNTLVAWKQISAGLDLTGSVLWSRLAATQEAIPTQSAWAGTGLAFLRTSIRKNDAFEVFVRGRTMAPTAANLQATIEVPAFLRADLGVNYRLFDEAVISLSVDNVFDDRSLETLNKLPLPGRAFLASVRVFDLAKK